jgi:hypothetical protein
MSACQPCPTDAVCLFGSVAPVPLSLFDDRSYPSEWVLSNPYDSLFDRLASHYDQLRATILVLAAVLLLAAFGMGYGLEYRRCGCGAKRDIAGSLSSLDLLFSASHVPRDGDLHRRIPTVFGALFSVGSITLFGLLAYLLVSQNTQLLKHSVTSSGNFLLAGSRGRFRLALDVYGNGLDQCGKLNGALFLPPILLSMSSNVTYVYSAEKSVCSVEWLCVDCSGIPKVGVKLDGILRL